MIAHAIYGHWAIDLASLPRGMGGWVGGWEKLHVPLCRGDHSNTASQDTGYGFSSGLGGGRAVAMCSENRDLWEGESFHLPGRGRSGRDGREIARGVCSDRLRRSGAVMGQVRLASCDGYI